MWGSDTCRAVPCIMETGIMENVVTLNLATCPPELLSLDVNATTLWPVLLRKVSVTISKGEHIEDRRALKRRQFGGDGFKKEAPPPKNTPQRRPTEGAAAATSIGAHCRASS